MPEDVEIELNDDELARNDEIDNAVFDCIKILVENDDLEWDMQIIHEATEAIKTAIASFHLHVRHPGVISDDDGTQHKSSL